MPTITLLIKAPKNFHLKHVNKFLEDALNGLKVKTEICGVTSRGWVQIVLSGEDEKVALRYLADEIGFCPTRLEDVEKFSTIKGRVTAMDKSRNEINIDVGVFSPKIVDAVISLQQLQAQLADGRKVALNRIIDLFGFCNNLPLSIKISNINKENTCIDAILSEKQLIQFRNWTKLLLDRLIVLGVSLHEIEEALNMAGVDRDVVNIEPLGLFEYAVECKLGTDAAGLISKIGKKLRGATFSVFSPRKILAFLGDYVIA